MTEVRKGYNAGAAGNIIVFSEMSLNSNFTIILKHKNKSLFWFYFSIIYLIFLYESSVIAHSLDVVLLSHRASLLFNVQCSLNISANNFSSVFPA